MKREDMVQGIHEKILKDSAGRRDICTIYRDIELTKAIVEDFAKKFEGKVDYVAAPESLGFILGSFLSAALGVGFIPIRNGDIAVLNQEDAIRSSYIDHSDISRTLQVRRSNLPKGSRILLVDDWMETGATHHACRDILDEAGANLAGIVAIGCNLNDRTKALLDQGALYCIIKE